MSIVRRSTTKDATWARAWTVDSVTELASIPEPRHGDVAYVTNGGWYSWRDDLTWAPDVNAVAAMQALIGSADLLTLIAWLSRRVMFLEQAAGVTFEQTTLAPTQVQLLTDFQPWLTR